MGAQSGRWRGVAGTAEPGSIEPAAVIVSMGDYADFQDVRIGGW
ncbi:hypothetical protein USDA257_c20240 [Sinorhizobium fredii USDA 257]|uniref:Uncharacterized protein n=1 Tax=Sinorhizobium fredii (strain USDA 257) TaxID=1185652 RepID=I3X401_SINF2|nr:hypothetical protein USDA257_c20240 [Sinorhizobium fredii USDA 257]